MNWYIAKHLAQALLDEMGFDPLKVLQLDDDDLADKLGYLRDDLAEALLSFCEVVGDDAHIRDAIKRFAERPKVATDLTKWLSSSHDWTVAGTSK